MNKGKLSTHELVHTFIQTDKLHRSLVEMRMADLNIHRSQQIMLRCISSFAEPPTQKQIAEKLDISAATVAITLKKLEAAGYITKSSEKEDNRCNRVSLSRRGLEILAKAKDIIDDIDASMMKGFTDEEQTFFAECLLKIQNNLKNSGAVLPTCYGKK